jgi:hypothetical protein
MTTLFKNPISHNNKQQAQILTLVIQSASFTSLLTLNHIRMSGILRTSASRAVGSSILNNVGRTTSRSFSVSARQLSGKEDALRMP